MIKLLICFLSAVFAYLICSVNPAIEISKRVYKKDIRECNSKNPGFTNFKRSFGMKWAVPVLLFDLLKAAVIVLPSAFIFKHYIGDYTLGAAYTGFFCMLGHSFPIYYRFKGGKGFLVYMSVIFLIDPIAGLIATAVLSVLLLTVRYMSLATMSAVTAALIALIILGHTAPVILLCSIQTLFIIYRHRENIVRLIKGNEPKFYFSH